MVGCGAGIYRSSGHGTFIAEIAANGIESVMNATMGKSTRQPILAAGGIVVRNGGKPLVAIVQRRRDNAWVLPKGKLKANEKPIAAARREAMEETGADVRVHVAVPVLGDTPVHAVFIRAPGGSQSNALVAGAAARPRTGLRLMRQ